MKDQADKHLDNLTKRVFKDSALESPSINFMDNVMAQVNELAKNRVTVYKPLISNKTWIVIAGILFAIILWVIFNGNHQEFELFSKLNLHGFAIGSRANAFFDFKLSDTFMYAIIFFGIMLSLQMSFLKRYYDQQFH